MPCSGKWARALALVCALLFGGLGAADARGAEISVRDAQLSPGDEGWLLSADFVIPFNPRLEEAVNKGVVLYFVVEFELTRSRWYWFDAEIARRSKTFQLSYHALTRQFRLSTGALHQSFATLDEALAVLGRLRNWPVVDRGDVRPEQAYDASLRLRLDLTQMPKPFQVSALANRDWNLASEWAHWRFVASAPPPPPPPPPPAPAVPPPPPPVTPPAVESPAPTGDGK